MNKETTAATVTASQDDAVQWLYEKELVNPEGIHLEKCGLAAGFTYYVGAGIDEDRPVILFGDDAISPSLARDLAGALLAAVEAVEA